MYIERAYADHPELVDHNTDYVVAKVNAALSAIGKSNNFYVALSATTGETESGYYVNGHVGFLKSAGLTDAQAEAVWVALRPLNRYCSPKPDYIDPARFEVEVWALLVPLRAPARGMTPYEMLCAPTDTRGPVTFDNVTKVESILLTESLQRIRDAVALGESYVCGTTTRGRIKRARRSVR